MASLLTYFGEPLGEPKYKKDETIWAILTMRQRNKCLIIPSKEHFQWLSDDHFSSRYGQKRFFGPRNVQCPNMVIWAQTPKNENFQKYFASPQAPYQYASNKPSTTIRWSFFTKIWPKTFFDVDPYVALQTITPIGENIKPLKITRSFTPYNWRKSLIFKFLISFW